MRRGGRERRREVRRRCVRGWDAGDAEARVDGGFTNGRWEASGDGGGAEAVEVEAWRRVRRQGRQIVDCGGNRRGPGDVSG